MRRLFIITLFSALLLPLFAQPAVAETDGYEWTANFSLMLGSRTMKDRQFWKPDQEQQMHGGEVDFGLKHWPVLAYAGVLESSNSANREITDSPLAIRMREYSVGVKSNFPAFYRFTPYLGAGSSILTAEERYHPRTTGETRSREVNASGFFGMAGVMCRLGDSVNVGIGARMFASRTITIYNTETTADYSQYYLIFGGGF